MKSPNGENLNVYEAVQATLANGQQVKMRMTDSGVILDQDPQEVEPR